MRNTKGQVTVFIILGVLIVLVATVGTYLRNDSFRDQVQSNLFKTTVVPEQAQGVVNFVSGCIEDIAKDGIEIMGMQGGYIDIPSYIENNPRSYLQFTENIKIPYWLYSEDITNNIPSLGNMKLDLKDYVETRFNQECNLQIYEEQGYSLSRTDIEVNVNILKNNIFVDLNSNLNIKIKENSFDLEKYISVNIPSKLMEFHEMANEIIDKERDGAPLEFNTLNMISLWSKDEDSGIPPVSGFSYDCNPDIYILNEVGEELMRRISITTPYLQIEKTDIQDFGDEFYDSMLLKNVFPNDHGDVTVQFNFFEGWPFVLDVTPRTGPILKSDVLKIGIPFVKSFCYNSYDFRYDLLYPLTVDLESDGELFRFPIEIYLDKNYGRRNAFGNSFRLNNVPELFCNDNQKLSNEVTVNAIDKISGEYLEDVNIDYVCGIDICYMGDVKEQENGKVEFRSKYPFCHGGEIKLNKEGYGIFRQGISITPESLEQSFVANLDPYQELIINLEIIELSENNDILGTRFIHDSENAFIQLNKINEQFGGYDDTFVVEINNLEDNKINLVPGKYNVGIDLVSNEERKLLGMNYEGIEIEGETIDSVVLGHIEIGDLIITNDIYDVETIKFKVFAITPKTIGDLIKGYELQDVVEKNRGVLDPVYE
jgi:hypothetical protein